MVPVLVLAQAVGAPVMVFSQAVGAPALVFLKHVLLQCGDSNGPGQSVDYTEMVNLDDDSILSEPPFTASIPYDHLLEYIEFDEPPLPVPEIPSHIQEQHGGISATRADGTFLTGIVTCTSQRFQHGKSPRQRARSLKNDNSNDICDAGNPSEPSTAPGRQRRRSHAKCEEQRSSNEPSAEAEKRHLSFHVVISG
ncbi:hypothetical protein ACLKA6_006034 [Drosophila palustris]